MAGGVSPQMFLIIVCDITVWMFLKNGKGSVLAPQVLMFCHHSCANLVSWMRDAASRYPEKTIEWPWHVPKWMFLVHADDRLLTLLGVLQSSNLKLHSLCTMFPCDLTKNRNKTKQVTC